MATDGKMKGYEVSIGIAASRDGAEGLRYVQTINARLKLVLRRSGRFPEARFDSSDRKNGILRVYGVPEGDLRAELDRCNMQASRDHGYAFTYQLSDCEADTEKAQGNEIADYDALLAEKEEEAEILRRRLKETQDERTGLEGQLKLLKMSKSEPQAETITRTVIDYPHKSIMQLLEGYSGDIDKLDHFFEPFIAENYEVDLGKMLELAGASTQEFARAIYGDRIAGLIGAAKKKSFFVPVPCETEEEAKKINSVNQLRAIAVSYRSFVETMREAGVRLPCAIVPKNDRKLSLYVPKSKYSKGPVSKLLFHTVRDIVQEANPLFPVEGAKHDFVREVITAVRGDWKGFARSLANELELKANQVLPPQIGYGLYAVNFLNE